MTRSGELWDALVVGSGAGGGTLAYGLARHGARVLVVEKGPHYTIADFARDELRVCRRDFFTPYIADEPNYIRYQAQGDFVPTRRGWTACCVGGGTVHMSGFFYRMHPIDFRLRRELGAADGLEVFDWPIDYEALEPYYSRAEYLLGVSGDSAGNPYEPPRAKPYPLPPLDDHPAATHLDGVLRALGWHPFHTPRAVLSRAYDGRPRCTYSGLCANYGCETGAKSSVLATVLPKALATGRCRVLPRHLVSEILVDGQGNARGAVLLDDRGQASEVRARVVCLAAGAVQTARLLLNSRSSRFPNGLANNNGRVGKHLHMTGFGLLEAELLFEGGGRGIRDLRDPRPWLGRSAQDFYVAPAAGTRLGGDAAALKGGTIRFDWTHPNPIFNAERAATRDGKILWGRGLREALHRRFHEGKTLEAEIFAEFFPTSHSRVDVHPRERDRFGVPVAAITLASDPRNRAAAAALVSRAKEAFEALGADRVDVLSGGEGVMYVLQGGTCAFGMDPAVSVLDPSCRAHEVRNLYAVDGSFLPTSSGVPATLTIHANALRVAEIITGRLRDRQP